MSGSSSSKSLLKQIRSNLSQQKYSDTLPLIKSLLKKQPDSIFAYLYLGFCFLKLSQYDKCEIAFQKASELVQEQLQDSSLEKDKKTELYNLKGEIIRGHLETLYQIQLEKPSVALDAQFLEKKKALYGEILENAQDYLPSPQDPKWWRFYADLYLQVEDSSRGEYPLHGDMEHISDRLTALRKMLSLCDEDNQLPDTLTLSQENVTLSRHVILYNLLQAIKINDQHRIQQQTDKHMEQFVEEKKEEAFQRLMKKRKCSRGEANMLLYGQTFVSDQEKELERNNYIAQLEKDTALRDEDSWDKLFEEYRDYLDKHLSTPVNQEFYLNYLKRQYAKMCHEGTSENADKKDTDISGHVKHLVSISVDMLQKYQVVFYPMKLLLFLKESDQWRDEFLTLLPNAPSQVDVFFRKMCNKLVSFFPHKGISQSIISKGMIDAKYAQNHIEQVEIFVQESIQQRCPMYISSWIAYAQLWYDMGKFKLATQLTRMALEKAQLRTQAESLTFSQQIRQLKSILCNSLFSSDQLDESENVAKELLREDKNNTSALKSMARVAHAKGKNQLAIKLYERVLSLTDADADAHCELGYLFYLQGGEYSKSEQHLKEALKLTPNNYLVHHRLGLLYWTMGGEYRSNKSCAYSSFLQSAKLNPRLSSNFTHLGHYYFTIEKDVPRAQKCYQKAVTLNPLEKEAGENLASIYQSQNQHELALALFQEATEKNSRAHWAWKRLGFHQQAHQEYDAALKSFQFALRANSNDAMTWEGLAETYHRQGKYLAASKAYARCFELDSTSVYALSQIGVVSHLLGELNDAYVTFQSVIEADDSFVLGYTGLSEVLFDKAKEYYENGILVTCAQHLIAASVVLNTFVKKNNEFKTVWKLLGDISCMLFLLSSEVVAEANQMMANHSSGDSSGNFVIFPRVVYDHYEPLSKKAALSQASDAYSHLTKLDPTSSDHHFDLGVSYAYRFLMCADEDSQKRRNSSEQQKKLQDTAIASLHEAIRLNPNNWIYWNCLGCIIPDEHLKQHCFIKSIQKNSRAASPWNNLGALYMEHNQYKMAQKAFTNAQNISPRDAISWIGLAIINERRLTEENADSFRETLVRSKSAYAFSWSLKNSLTASLGYAHTAFLHGDHKETCHAIMKYLQLDAENPIAWNIFGLALESLGKFENARDTLEIALEKAHVVRKRVEEISAETNNNSSRTAFSSPNTTILVRDGTEASTTEEADHLISVIAGNLARIFCHLNAFDQLSELLSKYSNDSSLGIYACNAAINSKDESRTRKLLHTIQSEQPQMHLLVGLSHMQNKKWKDAQQSIEKYLSHFPRDFEGHILMSMIAGKSSKDATAAAVAYLRNLSRQAWKYELSKSQVQEILLYIASLLLLNDQILESLHFCSEALQIDPTNHKVLLSMLKCVLHPKYLSLENTASSLETITSLCKEAWERDVGIMLDRCQQNQKDAHDMYILLGTGMLLTSAQVVTGFNADEVVAQRITKAALNALRLEPSSIEAYLLLIASASLSKNPTSGVESLIQTCLQMTKEEASGHAPLPNLKFFLKLLLAQQLILQGKYSDCISYIEQCLGDVNNDQHSAGLLCLKAIAQNLEGDATYKRTIGEALSKDSSDDTRLIVSSLLLKEGELELVDQLLEPQSASTEVPTRSFAVCALRSLALNLMWQNGKGAAKGQISQQAGKVSKQLVDQYNMSGIAHFLYGISKQKEGDQREAERQLLSAAVHDSKLPFVNQMLYELYYNQERWMESEMCLLQEIRLRSRNAHLRFLMADFAFQSNYELDIVLRYLDECLALDADHQEALEMKKRLTKKANKKKKHVPVTKRRR